MGLNSDEPFTYASGIAAGWSRRRLDECTRVGRGLLVRPDAPLTPRVRALATLAGLPPDAYVSHETAARLLGLPVNAVTAEHATVRSASDRRKGAGRAVHVRAEGEVVRVDGVRASAPLQVWSELARTAGLVEQVVLGDAIVARGWAEAEDFASGAAAGAFVRRGVESPMESRLRMLVVLSGLPEPEINPEVRDEGGQVVRRYDLYYRRSRTALEYDGRHHIEREGQWSEDLLRREKAESDGDRLLVMTAADVFRTPGRTVARVADVLRQRGEPGIPARLRQEWRLHFRE